MNLAFADASQPNVLCIQVLQHLPEYQQAVRELMRITGRRLYIATWFQPGEQDHLAFGHDLQTEKGPGFHLNRYSLPNFLRFIRENAGRPIEDLRVKFLMEPVHAVCITFAPEQRASNAPPLPNSDRESRGSNKDSGVLSECHINIANLAMQKQRLQDEAEGLRKQCQDTQAQKEAQAVELKAELDRKTTRIGQAGVELTQVQSALRQKEAQAAALKTDLDRKSAEGVRLSGRIEHASVELAQVQGALRQREMQASELKADLDRKTARVEQSGVELAQVQGALRQRETQVSELKADLDRKSARIEQASLELAQVRDALREKEAQAAVLRTDLDRKSDEGTRLSGRIERMNAELAQAQGALRQREAQAAALKSDLDRKSAEAAKLATRIEQAGLELAEAQEALRRKEAQAAELKSDSDRKSGEAVRLSARAEQTKAELAQSQGALRQKESQAAELAGQVAERQQQVAQLSAQAAEQSAQRQKLALEMAHARSAAIQATRGLAAAQRAVRRRPRFGSNVEDLWESVPTAYQQFKDDAILFGLREDGWRLTAVHDITGPAGAYLAYPLRIGALRLAGIWLAPICPVLEADGALGIEIVSPGKQIVLNAARPLRGCPSNAPFLIEFAPIALDSREGWEFRVFARDNDVPVGLFEFQKDRLLGMRMPWRRPFIALQTV
jgi:hypothetical protein